MGERNMTEEEKMESVYERVKKDGEMFDSHDISFLIKRIKELEGFIMAEGGIIRVKEGKG